MKHRTFLTTLLLFLLTINLGITVIAVHSYNETLQQARKRSASEHYFIACGLLQDIAAMDSRNADYKQGITQLVLPYGYLAGNQNAGLALYEGDTLLYANIPQENEIEPTSLPKDGERRIVFSKQGADAALCVAGRLPEPYSDYVLIYRSVISDTIQGWQTMKNTMFGVGLILSGILAVCLLVLLNKLFRPLTAISKSSRCIAQGEYTARLTVKGKDELAEMAESFNHMADEIERQIEELVDTANNKQLFIDNFAHELKTPLTAIYGYAEYLQKASIPQEDRDFALECILSQSSRIQTMAYQMMELANLRTDQIQQDIVSVSELFLKVKQAVSQKGTQKNIDLVFLCQLDTIYGDVNLLESLLINLIDNGVKASEMDGQIVVKAYTEENIPTITVEDYGKGIPKEAISHLTQPYYRVDKHRHRGDGGAGLGLAICEQIAARHQAKLTFISSPGKGTTVKIQFYNSIIT